MRAADWRGGRVPVEDFEEPRTKLADFFSILLKLVERLILQDSERFRCV